MSRPAPSAGRTRRPVALATVALLALATAACTSSGGDDEGTEGGAGESGGAYEVTLITDLTGPNAATLARLGGGAETYVDLVNDEGGIDGRPVELEILDSQSTADGGFAAAQRSVSEPPVAYAVVSTGSAFTRIDAAVASTGIPLVTVSASDADLYPKPNVFMVQPSTRQQAASMVAFAADQLDGSLEGRRIAIAGANTAFTDDWVTNIGEDAEEAGAETVATERFDFGLASFTAQAGNIVGADPDVVFIGSISADSPTIANALADAGFDGPILGYVSNASEAQVATIASESYFAPTENPYATTNPELLEAAEAAGHADEAEASNYFVSGFVSLAVIVEGLRQCGDGCDADGLRGAIEGIEDFEPELGVTYGPISFSADSHVGITQLQFHTWDGEAVVDAGESVDISDD